MKIGIILNIALLLTFNCYGQKTFQLTDSIFEPGKLLRINIIYEFSGSCPLSIESIGTMDSIADFLLKNQEVLIEFGVHTDYRGSFESNIILSERRASCLKKYCVQKGVDPERIIFKGYGESQPIIVNNEVNKKRPYLKLGQTLTREYIESLNLKENQEYANMLNRRTEVKILKK